jgi:hypothetical protein
MQYGKKPEVIGMLPHPEFRCLLPVIASSLVRSLRKSQSIYSLGIHSPTVKFRVTPTFQRTAGGSHVDVRPD